MVTKIYKVRLFGLVRCMLFLIMVSNLCLTGGCSLKKGVTTETREPVVVPGKMLMLPFRDMYKIYGEDITFRCPLCGAVHMTGKVEDNGDEFLTEQLFSLLQRQPGLQLIGPGEGEGARGKVLTESSEELSEVGLILETARQVGADSVLVCRVFRFIQRVGTGYSVETPASVAFDLLLLSTSDGQLVWSGKFDETQKALNENLFQLGTFVKRKAKWLTAEELALFGLKTVLKTFPESP
jgi:hypothetical protein